MPSRIWLEKVSFPECMANTPVEPLSAPLALFPSGDSFPRFNVRVGFHITLFEIP